MGTCDFISGWAGGIFGLVTGHPFDTVKVNQQNRNVGMMECTKEIFATQGMKGYFRGMAFPLISASAINSIFFGVYRVSLERIMEFNQADRLLHIPCSNNLQELQHQHKYFDNFVAGCIGGFAQLILTIPVELVKIQLQATCGKGANCTSHYRGPLAVTLHILKTKGVLGLYQGTGITFLRDVPSGGVYMFGYSVLSERLKNIPGLNDVNENKGEVPNAMRTLIAGGLAGTLSWWSIIPLDVIKSRIQADDPVNPRYKGWLDCGQQIFKKYGLRGFMRGALPLSLRAFPVNAVTFLGYEWTNSLCLIVASKNYF